MGGERGGRPTSLEEEEEEEEETPHADRCSRALVDVRKLLDICGVPSISLGILYHGKVVFRASVGFRDVDRKLRADADSRYLVGSVSKTFLAALAAIADAEGVLNLDDPLSTHLPALEFSDPSLEPQQATLRNTLHHTTGLSNPQILYLGPSGSILHTAASFLTFAASVPATNQGSGQLGHAWVYNNTAYGLLPLAIEAVYTRGYSGLLRDKILAPLGLSNTAITRAECVSDAGNVASPYVQLSDRSFYRLRHGLTDETNPHVLAVMGMQSSVNDLLAWTKALMAEETAAQHDEACNQSSILRGTTVTREPCQTWSLENVNAWSYCMGWTKTQIPTSKFGALSYNFAARSHRSANPEQYILGGNETTRRTVIQSNGTVNGSNCGLYTFPKTESAIVVCSNGLTNGDATDWAARIMTQALFNLEPHIDYLELARIEADARKSDYQAMLTEWERNHDPSPQTRDDMSAFAGVYHGMAMTLTITPRNAGRDISIEEPSTPDRGCARAELQVVFNGVESSKRDLAFYAPDTWSFFPTSRDEWLKDQMLDWDFVGAGLFFFFREGGEMRGLKWKWDENEGATTFWKQGDE